MVVVMVVAALAAFAAVVAGIVLLVAGDATSARPAPRITAATGATTSTPPTTVGSAPPTSATVSTPSPGAPYPVGRATTTVVDATRGTAARGPTPESATRSLSVRIRYPSTVEGDDAPPALGTFPLVVFAHGFGIAAADYDAFTRDLAADDATFAAVARHFDAAAIVELTVLIGTYNMHARVMNALQLDLEQE